jgi:outer membrane receptor protein involved in Fe transport
MRYARLLLLSSCFLLTSIAVAQVNTGRINGTVMDNSGAVVTSATVTATNPDTGVSQPTKTNNAGEYNFPVLPPASYNVRVEAAGFGTQQQRNVVLAVGQVLTLNFTLKPGSASEVIEVTGEAPLVETGRSDISGNVTPVEVRDLPVRDRNFASLMSLVPGVRPAPNFDPTKSRSGTVTANGSDGRSFDYNVDGGDDKDNVIGGIVQNYTLEGIQEFNVITDRYTAESGRAVGGIVNVITKSGTNRFHGSGFGEFQNSFFNASSFFDRDANGNPLPKENFKRYHMGGSIGGPIIKDRLFFFGAYEYQRELAKLTPDPTAVENLSLITTVQCGNTSGGICGQPFAEPAAKISQPFFQHLATIKLDYKINDKQSMFVRYGRERWLTTNDQSTGAGTPIADLTEANDDTNQFHSLILQHTYTLANNKVNAINIQFQDFVNKIIASPTRTFTLPVAGGGTAVNPLVTFPSTELGTNINIPQQTLIRKYQFRDDFSFVKGRHSMKFGGNYIYLAKMAGFFATGLGYEVDFWDNPTDILANPTDYPQALATPGAVHNIFYSAGDSSTTNPQSPHLLGLYYQDDFKVTPHLTLNLGLRWDANINFLNAQLTDDPLTTNRTIAILRQVVAANPGGAAADGLARAQYLAGNDSDLRRKTASFREFQPRFGFAWDPTGAGKLVIRGGFGIARDQIFQNLTLWSIQQSNRTIYQSGLIDLENNTRPPSPGPDPFLSAFQFGITPLPAPAGPATDLAFGARGRITDPHITDPWAEQASIGFSYQFRPEYALSVDYYHVLGFHEFHMLDDNPRLPACQPDFGGNANDPVRCPRQEETRLLDPAFVAAGLGAGRLEQIRTAASTGRSLFDSVNFVLKRRMNRNFMFQASYVLSWSRSWGGVPTSSYGGSFLTVTRENQFLPNEFGATDFDERHRFVFSGVFNLPYGFELAPIFQASSARPIDFWADTDLNGDGRTDTDRVCVGSTITNPIFTPGCTMLTPNTLRGKPFVQMDLAAAKNFKLGESASLRFYWQFFNLFNRFNECNSVNNDSSTDAFLTPLRGPISGPYCAVNGGVYGAGGAAFGPGIATPFRSQFGLRVRF